MNEPITSPMNSRGEPALSSPRDCAATITFVNISVIRFSRAWLSASR